MIFDRQQLEAFFAVVATRNFGAAAVKLSVTRSAISQRIKALEEAFGVPLLVRDGNIITPAGESLLRHIRAIKVLEADTLQSIKPTHSDRVEISIAVNADSLATWFEAVAWTIAERSVSLELIVDDQDYTLPLLASGQAIGCVSTSRDSPTGFIGEYLGAMEYECVANPEFVGKFFSQGFGLHGVLSAPAVLYNRKDGLHSMFLERFLNLAVKSYAAHFFPSPVALLSAIERGVGYGLVPSSQARHLIEVGKLIRLAPEHKIAVDLYWHHWETEPANTQEISDLVVRYARQMLVQPADATLYDGSDVDLSN